MTTPKTKTRYLRCTVCAQKRVGTESGTMPKHLSKNRLCLGSGRPGNIVFRKPFRNQFSGKRKKKDG